MSFLSTLHSLARHHQFLDKKVSAETKDIGAETKEMGAETKDCTLRPPYLG